MGYIGIHRDTSGYIGIHRDRAEHLVNHEEVRHLVDDSRSSSRTLSSIKSLDHGCLVLLPPPHRLQDNCPCLLLEVLGLQHTLGNRNNPSPHNRHLRPPLQSGGKVPFKRRTHLLCSSLRPCAVGLPSRRTIPSRPDEADTGLQEHIKI